MLAIFSTGELQSRRRSLIALPTLEALNEKVHAKIKAGYEAASTCTRRARERACAPGQRRGRRRRRCGGRGHIKTLCVSFYSAGDPD